MRKGRYFNRLRLTPPPTIGAEPGRLWEAMPECVCTGRRGPPRGVCGNCNGAIPAEGERPEREDV